MRLDCQEAVTQKNYNTLTSVVTEPKNRGQYDLGIKNISGEVVVEGKPRVFRFRGLKDPDESVLLYKVKVDSGIDSNRALGLYEDAVKEDGVTGRGQRDYEIKTGFYIDDRARWKKTPKVFLIIKQSNITLSNTVLAIRPNIGRR